MVYSRQTATFYGGKSARQNVEDHTLGMYQALIEARIPFEMAHDRLLDAAHIDRFKLLILPNIAALSEQQCEQLRQYVTRGGSLLATHETSLYDEWGVRRQNFGLSSLFGVKFNGIVRGEIVVHADTVAVGRKGLRVIVATVEIEEAGVYRLRQDSVVEGAHRWAEASRGDHIVG